MTILDIGTHVSTLLLCLLLPFLITFEEEEKETAVYLGVSQKGMKKVCVKDSFDIFPGGWHSPRNFDTGNLAILTVLLLRAIFVSLAVCGFLSNFGRNWTLEMVFSYL